MTLVCISVIMMYDLYRELRTNVGTHILGTFFGGLVMNQKRILNARKELQRIGTSKASGDALRFMYANMLAFERGLSVTANSIVWPIPDLFNKITGVTAGEIRDSYLELKKEL